MKRSLRVLVSLVCLLGTSVIQLSAQTPAVPSDALAWDMRQDATGLTFVLLVDGVRQTLSGATCGAMSGGISVCRTPLPALTPGTHRLSVVAVGTVAGTSVESAPSAELVITFIAIVAPENPRLIKG